MCFPLRARGCGCQHDLHLCMRTFQSFKCSWVGGRPLSRTMRFASALLRPDQRRVKRYISSALILQPSGRLRARKMMLWEIICARCGNTIVNAKLCNDAPPSHAAAPCMACQRPQPSMLFLNFLYNCSGEHCYRKYIGYSMRNLSHLYIKVS
jgi:hypothetical protein